MYRGNEQRQIVLDTYFLEKLAFSVDIYNVLPLAYIPKPR